VGQRRPNSEGRVDALYAAAFTGGLVSGIFHPPTDAQIAEALSRRTRDRIAQMGADALPAYLADTVYLERKRFGPASPSTPEDQRQHDAVEAVARATHRDRDSQETALLHLVELYAQEIHNRFSARTYGLATKVLPAALTRLLTAAQPRELLGADFDPTSRIAVQGPVALISELAQTHTLVLAPTHLSNLDSPLLGYALHASNLPPVIYGAGLNLFSNPALAFFMSRLGAYTVDRRKKNQLYKDVLKDYSTEMIGRRCHSLFFPGGTRARSGRIENSLKKGLLGTGITAWQEGLEEGRAAPEVLVVPCTMSYALVLEAETLIEDALADEGKARYIITDDESSEARTVASFARRVLNLDASVYVRFGHPLDLLGHRVDNQGRSLDDRGELIDRRQYVADRSGTVVRDPQRDQIYTTRLSAKLVEAWHRDNVALSTHVACLAAMRVLEDTFPRYDTWQLMVLGLAERLLPRQAVLAAMERLVTALHALRQANKIQLALPGGDGTDGVRVVLDDAIDRFSRFHRTRAIEQRGSDLLIEPKLVLYYANRLRGYGLEGSI
jgi:glycerol-3-phosphate O-acyltransferase